MTTLPPSHRRATPGLGRPSVGGEAKPFTFGSLFAGIGGMDLGLERAGMTCSWQVEIDPYAQRVLAKHWPNVRRHDDVRTFPPGESEGWAVDLICGGFPCQDISYAGKGAGLEGERSGLWFQYARIIRVLRPRFVLVENVSALLVRGLDRVLGSLAKMGYDAEWGCISAAAFGAPHLRERLFVLADTDSEHGGAGRSGRLAGLAPWVHLPLPEIRGPHETIKGAGHWADEPGLVRLVHGLPANVVEDRIRGLGNAVVPQVAQWIGERIMEAAR